jgi:NitT/TauT family transport system substrate-binding protein
MTGKLLVVALLLASTGAATSTALAQSTALQTVRVAAGGRAQVAFLPLTAAEQLGYFKQEGLIIEISDFQSGSKSVEALIAGNVDVLTGAYEHTLLMQYRGQRIQCLLLMNTSYGAVIALNKENAAKYKSPQDLRGLKMGVSAPGSAMALALEIFLRKAGMTLDDVSAIGVGQAAAAIAAVKAGRIDGISNPDPVITKLITDGDVVPILDTRTPEGQKRLYGGPIAAGAMSTTPAFIAKRPEIVQAYVRAVVRALQWLQKASDEEIMAIVPNDYIGPDRDLYRKALVANRGNFSQDGRVTPELARNTLAMLRIGPLSDAKNLNIDDTYVGQFVERALKP